MDRPPEKADQRIALLRVRLILVDEEPGEPGDRVRVFAGRVGDRDAVVVGDFGLPCRGGDRLQRRLDPGAVVILQLGRRQLVLIRVRQLDVADASVGLLDGSGDAFVALAAEAGRPVHALALTGTGLPLRRNLGEIIGED